MYISEKQIYTSSGTVLVSDEVSFTNTTAMFTQYLTAAWRNLLKHKLHSFLNIASLAIGLAACLIIISYVDYELSYDQHHPGAENIQRIALNRIYPTQSKKWAITAPIVAPTITDELPEVESFTRMIWGDYLLSPVDDKMQEQRIVAVDSGFFDIFHTPVISGKISNDMFKRKDRIILTESAARKYFADEEAVGQLFHATFEDEDRLLVVEAVIADPLPSSHFSYEVLCSFKAFPLPPWLLTSWGTWATYSYIKVHKDTDLGLLEEKINEISERNQGAGDGTYQAWLDAGNYYQYFLQPLTSIHLQSNLADEFEANSSESFVYFFAIVGFFILLMAVVNFVNLATAKASYRTMEVGIRKTIGASRADLIRQFLLESTLISMLALLIALPVTQLFIPLFNQMVGKSISMELYTTPVALVILGLTPVVLGMLSGFYPALYLSHFGPSSIFQKFTVRRGKQQLRHVLVVGQFVIAVILIAGTTTVYRQMHYIANKPLGFDKDQLISVKQLPFSDEKIDVFVREAKEIPGVHDLSITSFPFENIRSGISVRNLDEQQNWVNMTHLDADEHFIPVYGINLLAGRNFRESEAKRIAEPSDNINIIINATAAKSLGYSPDEAVDQVVSNGDMHLTIIGVVDDFNYSSLHTPVSPFLMSVENFPDAIRSATIKVSPHEMSETIDALDALWLKYAPDQLFVYSFLDESMAKFYEAEKLTGKLFILFSALAVFICCLGLFGLMGFVVERRAKEVGIRKVMGATISHIILLLSRDYIRLVLISAVIALPVAWWGLDQWLGNFAYRVNNSVWILLLAGMLVTLISSITVAYYALRSARSNPVNSLRNE
ncbi:FtsX-like permease family protein [Marinoscillum sp.]|uniref:ABC transporter permease n=1 Tax=Marinoscillum sp. TaxID=2024838 RepID=UPI003BACCB4C